LWPATLHLYALPRTLFGDKDQGSQIYPCPRRNIPQAEVPLAALTAAARAWHGRPDCCITISIRRAARNTEAVDRGLLRVWPPHLLTAGTAPLHDLFCSMQGDSAVRGVRPKMNEAGAACRWRDMWKGVRETGADRQDIPLCARGPGSAISVQAIQQTLSYRVASPMFGPASAGTCTRALRAQPGRHERT
jgi:hypothetical protein